MVADPNAIRPGAKIVEDYIVDLFSNLAWAGRAS